MVPDGAIDPRSIAGSPAEELTGHLPKNIPPSIKGAKNPTRAAQLNNWYRVKIMEETLELNRQGYYTAPNGTVFKLDHTQMTKGTKRSAEKL